MVKTTLKILAALVSVAVLWLGYRYVLKPRNELVSYETLTIDGGWISSETFVDVRDRIAQSTAEKKTFVVKDCGGGGGPATLALGILLHRHNWDVEVVNTCASSCANFIFPAGKTKYLNDHSMLLFHGGPHQANMLEMAEMFDRGLPINGAPLETVTLGHINKEGTMGFSSNRSPADLEVLEFLSMKEVSTHVELLREMRLASDQFYLTLGVNPLLPTYGQIGAYESTYKSYKFGGFIYRLDSLSRMGIGNIELKAGQWRPERHPDYPDVYEVTYP